MTAKFAAACGLAMLSSAAAAQVTPDIAEKIRAGGQAMEAGASYALFAPAFAGETYADLTVTRDVAYGADPLQKLDLYEPKGAHDPLPVMVFVHGGAFVRGDKHGAYYPDNFTSWAARNGMVGVNINYRLAPGAPYPGGAQDLAAALAWVRANIASHGGDPRRIVLWGHSAGANHIVDYIGHPELQGEEAGGLRGAILLSPNYVFESGPEPHVYYGTAAQSPAGAAALLRAAALPVFLGYAKFDPDPMRQTANGILDDLCAIPETCIPGIELPDHNHYTEGAAVGTSDASFTGPLLDWLRTAAL